MPRHRPAPLLMAALTGSLLVSGNVFASPARDLFQAASQDLLDHYDGWSDLDRPALISHYSETLDSSCAEAGDACSYDQGRAVVRDMLAQLHDAHTNIRDPEGAERLREVQQDLTVPRTGLRVVKTGLGLLVVGVMPGSPAEAAGVQRFDLLTRVNGQSQVDGQADAAAFVRLERQNDPIQAELLHSGQVQALTLTTAPMKARDVPILSWQPEAGGKIAVIQYPTFLSADSASLFLKTLQDARDQGAAGLVIDLRYNGGGRLDQCVQAASAFRPTVYQARTALRQLDHPDAPPVQSSLNYAALQGRLGSPTSIQSVLNTPDGATQALWHGPAAILVDENTASCAEVFGYFAHAAGAILVGQPTKGVMNSGVNFFPLPDHGVMSVTMLRAYDPAGTPLPDHLQPDVSTECDLKALTGRGQDTMLEAALGAVASKLAGGSTP